MFENIVIHFACRAPTKGDNVCFIFNDDQIRSRSKLTTLYSTTNLNNFILGLKRLKDAKANVEDDIIIVDYSTNIQFNEKLFYIAKIFKSRKQIHLYSNNFTRLI